MARASAADAARTAHDIIDSASELFAAHGFADVSVDDVARAAGVTRGAVYHHYRNKAGLFGAVASTLQRQVAGAVVATAESAGENPGEQLLAGCHAFIDAITAGPATRILLIDGPAVVGWEKWRQLDAENSEVHLREALTAVGVEDVLRDAMTAQLSGAMNEAAIWITQQPDASHARDRAHRSLQRLIAALIS
ncbi:MAG: TetR/AcrR family transcriptional regulator [Brevibacterium yomogidense]